ncbi:MAG: alpha/beta hydrolase [Muribaculaceae bacterium]|nr:alpha/beta hydrolase [Muribaculaceae bacterium]
MTSKLVLTFLGLGIFANFSFAKIPDRLLPTEKEKTAFLNEADDFIDDMAEGLQDRQCDAVLHSIRGEGAELMRIRMSRNEEVALSSNVERKDLTGDGAARGLQMRLYKPSTAGKDGAKIPLLVYLHGGGWTFGSINSCSLFCDALASNENVMVLAVDYRLAPENPFPAGLMDCVSAVEYAMSHAEEWGSSQELVSLGGDSSGGNLAVAASLYLQDQAKLSPIKSLVLFYPVVKAYADGSSSWKEYSRGYGLNSRLMNSFNEAYAGSSVATGSTQNKEKSENHNPLVSPAEAEKSQLAKLPPVLIIGAERDILYDQGKEFASVLHQSGNSVEHITFPGSVHLFITVKGQPTAFSKAVTLSGAFLWDK